MPFMGHPAARTLAAFNVTRSPKVYINVLNVCVCVHVCIDPDLLFDQESGFQKREQ